MPSVKLVRTRYYIKDVKKLKVSAEDVEEMERSIIADPLAGVLIQGLKGVRKVRFRIGNRGKSSGGRAIYYFLVVGNEVIMLMAYTKSEKQDLSPEDRKSVLRVLEELGR